MDEPSYSIELTRHDPDGGRQVVIVEHYGVLRELLDAIEAEATKNGWFEEES